MNKILAFATRMRTLLLFVAVFTVGMVMASENGPQNEHSLGISRSLTSEQKITLLHRKLIDNATTNEQAKCSKNDIVVVQGETQPQPNGMSTYIVEITNTCATGCAIANIHLNCSSFSSAILINPNIFKRLAINDCLVNDGQPLAAGYTLSFKYAATNEYPLSVSEMTC